MEMSESGLACIADYTNIYLTITHHFIGVLLKFESRQIGKFNGTARYVLKVCMVGKNKIVGRLNNQHYLIFQIAKLELARLCRAMGQITV
jgi:hypothetical protein